MAGPAEWTLDERQRCERCGFDPHDVRDRDLADAVRALGDRWEVFIDGFEHRRADGDALLHTRPGPDGWSAVEYGQHLSDQLRRRAGDIEATIATGRPPAGWREPDAGAPATAGGEADHEEDPDVLAGHIAGSTDALAELLRGVTWPNDAVARVARLALHEGYHHLAAADRSVAAQLPD